MITSQLEEKVSILSAKVALRSQDEEKKLGKFEKKLDGENVNE